MSHTALLVIDVQRGAFDGVRCEPVDQPARELVLCGLLSEFCVSNTAKAALDAGFAVTIAEDGHST